MLSQPIKILLTAIAIVASVERAFSKLNIKVTCNLVFAKSNWCRSQFILIENEIAKSIDFDDLISESVNKWARKNMIEITVIKYYLLYYIKLWHQK